MDLGYALLPDYRGKVHAVEAARGVKHHAASDLKLPRLVAIVTSAYDASRAVLLNLGMRGDFTESGAGAAARAASRGDPPHCRCHARRNCNPELNPATSAARVTVAPYSSDCRARSRRMERRYSSGEIPA